MGLLKGYRVESISTGYAVVWRWGGTALTKSREEADWMGKTIRSAEDYQKFAEFNQLGGPVRERARERWPQDEAILRDEYLRVRREARKQVRR